MATGDQPSVDLDAPRGLTLPRKVILRRFDLFGRTR